MPTIRVQGDRLVIDWSDGLTTNSRRNFLQFLKLKKEFVCPLSGKVVADTLLLQHGDGQLFCYDRDAVEAYVAERKHDYLKKFYACISDTVKGAKVIASDANLTDFSKGIIDLQQAGKDGVIRQNVGIFYPANKTICLADIKVKAIFRRSQNGQGIHLLKLVMQYDLFSTGVSQHIAKIQKKMQDLTSEFEQSSLRYASFFRKQGIRQERKEPTLFKSARTFSLQG